MSNDLNLKIINKARNDAYIPIIFLCCLYRSNVLLVKKCNTWTIPSFELKSNKYIEKEIVRELEKYNLNKDILKKNNLFFVGENKFEFSKRERETLNFHNKAKKIKGKIFLVFVIKLKKNIIKTDLYKLADFKKSFFYIAKEPKSCQKRALVNLLSILKSLSSII